MAFCRKCNAEVERDADQCPSCGYFPASVARRFAIGLFIFGGAATYFFPPIGIFGIFVGLMAYGWSYLATPAG